MRRLVTIPVSHFCEKARWALDLAGVPYREDGWAPAFHRLALARLRATTAPVLVTDDGAILRESTDIVRHADEAAELGLFGHTAAERREIEALVARFDEVLGPDARLRLYGMLLDDPDSFVRFATLGLSGPKAVVLRAGRPAVAELIRRFFSIDDAACERATARLEELLADADARRGGSAYLVGDRFTAADLTFAALSAPLVAPPEYGAPLPPVAELPPRVRDDVQRWRATPSGAAALEVYARHRRAGAGVAPVAGRA
jgi:glutathione S-transferase